MRIVLQGHPVKQPLLGTQGKRLNEDQMCPQHDAQNQDQHHDLVLQQDAQGKKQVRKQNSLGPQGQHLCLLQEENNRRSVAHEHK